MRKPYQLMGSDRYPNSYIGEYLGDPMQIEIYDFMKVTPLDTNHDYNLRFEVLTTMDKIRKYDLVQVNTPHRYLFSPKAIEILDKLCPEQIQVFDTMIECKDGSIQEFKAINILNEVDVSDTAKSSYTYFAKKIATGEKISGYKWGGFVIKNKSIEPTYIGREKYSSAIIISATLKEAFEKAKIKGCQYWAGD